MMMIMKLLMTMKISVMIRTMGTMSKGDYDDNDNNDDEIAVDDDVTCDDEDYGCDVEE